METTSSDFASAMEELNTISAWFEEGSIDIDAGLAQFERAMDLITKLRTRLVEVEQRVEQIKRDFSEPAQTDEA
ncbi:MAG: exodeoxyribonuclease VII small subunit [Actinomycetota bacterium]